MLQGPAIGRTLASDTTATTAAITLFALMGHGWYEITAKDYGCFWRDSSSKPNTTDKMNYLARDASIQFPIGAEFGGHEQWFYYCPAGASLRVRLIDVVNRIPPKG